MYCLVYVFNFNACRVPDCLFFLSLTPVRPPPLPTCSPPPFTPPVAVNSPSKNTTYKNGTHTTSNSTEMLEASVKSLRLNDKPEFRSGAGKLISMMLESRVAIDHATPPASSELLTSPHKLKKTLPLKSVDLVDTALPVIPIPPPLVPAKNEITLNHSSTHQSPSFKTLAKTSIQLPAPQSVLIKSFEQQPVKSALQTPPPHPAFGTEIPPNPSAESIPPTESSPERGPVVLRQRNGANKSASHARDRRSFIEKDGVQQVLDTFSGGDRNRLVDGGSIDMLPSGSISDDGLWNGAAPVCCVCNTKIQR